MSISPPPTTTTTTTTTTGTGTGTGTGTTLRPQTYWCHECDMSVLLLQPLHTTTTTSTTFPPICPHCRHDFLEEMDTFTSSPPPPNPTIPNNPFFEPFSPMDPTNPSDDTFLLESPYLHRLIHHLMTTPNNHPTPTPPPHYNSPASKLSIETLHHFVVDSAFLDLDPSLVCPVCKDQFVVASEAKTLPCKHTYHSDCIVPWLEMNNSCPVCRFRLPSESDERKKTEVVEEMEMEMEMEMERERERERESFVGAARLDELLDDEQDLFGFRNTLRNVVRRQQYNNVNDDDEERNRYGPNWNWNRRVQWDNEVLLSPTQIGEVEGVSGSGRIGDHVERANSVETVSSRLRWPVEGGASGSGSGDGAIGVGVSGGEGVVKGDAARS